MALSVFQSSKELSKPTGSEWVGNVRPVFDVGDSVVFPIGKKCAFDFILIVSDISVVLENLIVSFEPDFDYKIISCPHE